MLLPLASLVGSPGDRADSLALLELFGTAFGEPETYGGAIPDPAYLRRLLGREHVFVLVADAAAGLAGGLVAYELEKLEQARSEIYIYDLAVAEEYRRRGVATALIGALQRIASLRGAWVIFVQADLGDDPAVALYTKLGSREEVLHFDISVTPQGGNGP